VAGLKEELDELEAEWREYKKPLNEAIANEKDEVTGKKVEYKYKVDRIKEIKKELKEAAQELQ
jgi:predicted RNase H-like nuclease (RuvC/YqgF family)